MASSEALLKGPQNKRQGMQMKMSLAWGSKTYQGSKT